MTGKPTILITRPEPQASKFADACRRELDDPHLILSPILRPKLIGQAIQGERFSACVFTSPFGVVGADRIWSGPRPSAYAVGDQTASDAIQKGWNCKSAGGSSDDLANVLRTDDCRGLVAWPCGVDRTDSWIASLDAQSVRIEPIEVYQQLREPLSNDARAALSSPGRIVLPLFSERSATFAASETADAAADIVPVAISANVAAAFGAPVPFVASEPTADAVLARLKEVYSQAGP